VDTAAHVLARLALGPATLAQLRAALPDADLDRRALPTMGESDPFGEVVTALVNEGRVLDHDGRYRLP
jgi:hypothetical protein